MKSNQPLTNDFANPFMLARNALKKLAMHDLKYLLTYKLLREKLVSNLPERIETADFWEVALCFYMPAEYGEAVKRPKKWFSYFKNALLKTYGSTVHIIYKNEEGIIYPSIESIFPPRRLLNQIFLTSPLIDEIEGLAVKPYFEFLRKSSHDKNAKTLSNIETIFYQNLIQKLYPCYYQGLKSTVDYKEIYESRYVSQQIRKLFESVREGRDPLNRLVRKQNQFYEELYFETVLGHKKEEIIVEDLFSLFIFYELNPEADQCVFDYIFRKLTASYGDYTILNYIEDKYHVTITPLDCAFITNQNEIIINYLSQEYNFDTNAINRLFKLPHKHKEMFPTKRHHLPKHFTWLHFAARYNNVAVMALILEKADEIDFLQMIDFNPIHTACRLGNIEALQCFKKYFNKLHVNTWNLCTHRHMGLGSQGQSPLAVAIIYKQYQAVKFLLDQKAAVDVTQSIPVNHYYSFWSDYSPMSGHCFLHLAIKSDDLPIANLLLQNAPNLIEKKATLEYTLSKNCITPLDYAIMKKNLPMIKLLLSKGAVLSMKQNNEISKMLPKALEENTTFVKLYCDCHRWIFKTSSEGNSNFLFAKNNIGFITALYAVKYFLEAKGPELNQESLGLLQEKAPSIVKLYHQLLSLLSQKQEKTSLLHD